ncbi:MAG TPA: ankyrin repeat domain-containing protein [Kofleriaceae bacterium]|nr:ankyrin repeat domain-containing protein [Kofleriaceae bacterium]
MFFAAKRGDAAALRELAGAGVALAQSFPAYRGYSTLHLAAASGSTESVQLLLDAGIDPNIARDPNAPTPLMVASSVDIVRQLVAAGADLERRMLGFTAIVRACKRDDVASAHALLEAGATLPADVASAHALLEAGATLPADCFDQIAHACARHGNVALLRTLLEREPRLASALAAEDVMQAAIRSGESVLVDLLLQHGAALPDTLLEDAVRAGSVALVETALRAPDAVAACGSSSESWHPMCVAARTGNVPLLELLARHGVLVHPAAPGKTSPLHEAVQAASEPAITWLLDHGAPVNAATATGTTVFRHAIEHAPIEILALLSRRGADTTGVTEALTPAGRSQYYALGGEVTAPPEPPPRTRKRKRR